VSAWREGAWRIHAWRDGAWREMGSGGVTIIYFTGISKAREPGISYDGVKQRRMDSISYEGQETQYG